VTVERTTSELAAGRSEARLALLTAEVERLRADRDRLDWLDANARGFSWGGASAAATVRDAIDGARKLVLPTDLAEAAAEIERLRAENAALRAELARHAPALSAARRAAGEVAGLAQMYPGLAAGEEVGS
jgi:pimeloyl-ACP methyl ester carboxylesterase